MMQCSIPTREASKARARVGLHGGLSPLERHECPQNAPIPASCGSMTACMSSSWPCIQTPSPMSSCPEARASPRAWASFSPSSHGCGADRCLGSPQFIAHRGTTMSRYQIKLPGGEVAISSKDARYLEERDGEVLALMIAGHLRRCAARKEKARIEQKERWASATR